MLTEWLLVVALGTVLVCEILIWVLFRKVARLEGETTRLRCRLADSSEFVHATFVTQSEWLGCVHTYAESIDRYTRQLQEQLNGLAQANDVEYPLNFSDDMKLGVAETAERHDQYTDHCGCDFCWELATVADEPKLNGVPLSIMNDDPIGF